MNRRTFLRAAGAGGAAALAGCSAQPVNDGSGNNNTTGSGTTVGGSGPSELVVATYGAFVDAPSTSPGSWLKKQFEAEFDATVRWKTPQNGVNYFIERANAGVSSEADLYVGLDASSLIRADEKANRRLFANAGSIDGAADVKDVLRFDPKNRAVPFDTGYISLVYDGTAVEAPKTFDALAAPENRNWLLSQDPTASVTGKAFLLHTIKAKGPDGYLDYWRRLRDNVRVLKDWESSYTAYTGGEAPMVVSYSTDRVYAHRDDLPLSKHRIRFLNDQGYANPEGMAVFADSDRARLARRFMSFVLRPEIQGGIAARNVSFPATTDAKLPKTFRKYAKEPPNPVTFGYDALKNNLGTWTDRWARQFATG